MSKRRKQNMTLEEMSVWFYNQKNITDTGCWEWTRGMNSGYGAVFYDKKRFLAHRFSLQLFLKRPIEQTIEVRHMCHNTKCINPEHLKEGTHSENMNDMVIAGRQAKGEYLSNKCKLAIRDKIRGENNGRVKLTFEQVKEIRNNIIDNLDAIGRKYGVSGTHISRIKTGDSWKYHPSDLTSNR